MERITEYRDGYIYIKGCKSCYPSEERKGAPATNAIVRLAAYEDSGLMPDEIVFVKHGKWTREPGMIAVDVETCSICGTMMNERNQFWNANYCPSCGAKMDLEE